MTEEMKQEEYNGEELVFVVDGENIDYLHTDKVPLHRLGRVRTQRASNVEFDEDKQLWVAVEDETGFVIAEHELRDECIRQERAYFNQKLSQGHLPFRERAASLWGRIRGMFA